MRFEEVNTPTFNTPTTLPSRQTSGSAGYDFHLKEDVEIHPGETVLTFSDVKCQLTCDEVLYLHVRSSVGVKKGLCLANGTGVIDSDYYGNPDNDGNIGLPLYNYSKQTVRLKVGERVAQGLVHEFKREPIEYDGSWNVKVRQSGFGSTDVAEDVGDRINDGMF